MYVTMKEYLAAKKIDIDSLPIIYKTATGIHESIIFKGGIMAQLIRGTKTGQRCIWFPEEAKYVNKVLERQIFASTATGSLMRENNNCNTILFEFFGEVSVLWTIPIVEKIVEHFKTGLKSQFKTSQFVGHSIIINVKNLGNIDQLRADDKFPDLTSISHSAAFFIEYMSEKFNQIETCLNIDFLKSMVGELKLVFLGYDDTNLYFVDENDDLISFTYWCDERLNQLRKKLSFTSEKLINDYESVRL